MRLIYILLIFISSQAMNSVHEIIVDADGCKRVMRDSEGRLFILQKIILPYGSTPESINVTSANRVIAAEAGGCGLVGNRWIAGIRLYPDSIVPFTASISMTLAFKSEAAIVKKVSTFRPADAFARVFVKKEGIYSISFGDLVNAGMSASSINPDNIRMWTSSEECPIHVVSSQNGRFQDGDKILFYGTHESGTNGRFFAEQTFSKCYYVGIGTSPGLRSPLVYAGPQYLDSNGLIRPFDPSAYTSESRNIVRVSSYKRKIHLEEDNRIIRVSSPDSVRSDKSDPATIESAPDDYWMWTGMCSPSSATGKQDIEFFLDAPPAPVGDALLRVAFLGYGYSGHAVQLFLNNTRLSLSDGDSTLIWNGQRESQFITGLNANVLRAITGGKNTLSVVYARNDCLFLNWIEAEYSALPIYSGSGEMTIDLDTSIIKKRAAYLLQVQGFQSTPEIWDKEGRRYSGMQLRNGFLEIYDVRSAPASYILAPSIYRPEKIEACKDTTLVPVSGGADLLMIGPMQFAETAALHAAHRKTQNIASFFAPVETIYDKFGTGTVAPSAIKEYLSYAVSTFNPKPSYVLLLGDATELSDKRSRHRTLVPTFFTQVNGWGIASADTRFTTVSGDDPFPDISIGRIPGRTVEAVEGVLSKIRTFEKTPKGGLWRDDIVLLGGLESEFTEANNHFHKYIAGKKFNVRRADADPLSMYNFGAATSSEVSSLFNKGSLFSFFYGHGGGSVWSDGRPLPMMDHASAAALSNLNCMPIVLSMTCLTGSFETITEGLSYDLFPPLGETMLMSTKGGSSAFYGASGHSFSNSDYMLGEILLQEATYNRHKRIGDLINAAEESMVAAYGAEYFHVIAQYNLLGDPSMPILYPDTLTSVSILNKNPLPGDTLKIEVKLANSLNGDAVIRVYGEDGLLALQYSTRYSGTIDTLFLPLRDGRPFPEAILKVLMTDGNNIYTGQSEFATSIPSINDARLLAVTTSGDTLYKTKYSLNDSIEVHFAIRKPSGISVDSAFIYWQESLLPINNVLPKNRDSVLLLSSVSDSVRLEYKSFNRIFIDPQLFSNRKGLSFCVSIRYRSADNISRLMRQFYHVSVYPPPDLAFLLKDGLKLLADGRLAARVRYLNQGESDASPFNVSLVVNSDLPVVLPSLDVLPVKKSDSIDFPLYGDGYITVKAVLDPDNSITETDKGNNTLNRYYGIKGTTLGRLDTILYAPYGGLSVRAKNSNDTMSINLIQDEIDSIVEGKPRFSANAKYPMRPGQIMIQPYLSDTISRYSFSLLSDTGKFDIIFRYRLAYKDRTTISSGTAFGMFMFDTSINYWRFVEGSIDSQSYTVTTSCISGSRFVPGYKSDMEGPIIRALSAGRTLDFPDYIPVETPIDILFEDNSAVDTGSIKLFLKRFEPMPRNRYSLGYSGGSGNAVVSFRPFRKGTDSLYAIAKDVNNNSSDTLKVSFTLGSRLALRSFANHPNPFGSNTVFAFTLEDEADVKIQIYTLAGYLVTTLRLDDAIGYREISWDATNKNGRKIPNGTYYAKFIAKNRTSSIERIFKIAKTEGR